MAESFRIWLADPEWWHAHPSTVLAGALAAAIVTVIFAAVFWIKGRWWP
jgi:hypothetical protein